MFAAVSLRTIAVWNALGITALLPDSRDSLHLGRLDITRSAAVDARPNRSTGFLVRNNIDFDVQQHQWLLFPTGIFPKNHENYQPDYASCLVVEGVRCRTDPTPCGAGAGRQLLRNVARLYDDLFHNRLVAVPCHRSNPTRPPGT